jgi:small subunit ribosomal protein S8
MQTDPLSDFLTQIRNANLAFKMEVNAPYSNMKHRVAEVLKQEGFVDEIAVKDETQGKRRINVKLRYQGKNRAITKIKRGSKPGLRQYVGATEIPRVLGGLGVVILSTSRGVMSGREAKKQNVGGEVLAYVW